MIYAEKLKDPRWQKKRLETFERDNWTCQFCGNRESTLCVHHKHYERGKEPWDYAPDILITLCEECHETETTYRFEAEKDVTRALWHLGLSCTEVGTLAIQIEHAPTEATTKGKVAQIP